jgi:diguanylate cyclase (GGDEF)-like protein/PAS domain S-box-containing protein
VTSRLAPVYGFAALCGLLALVAMVVPSESWAQSIELAAPALTVSAILIGLARHQPTQSMPWLSIALGMAMMAAASVIWSAVYFQNDDPFPSLADVFHLASLPPILFGVLSMLRRQKAGRDVLASFEAAIVTIAGGLLTWLVVIEPYISNSDLPLVEKVWAALFPLIDMLLVAAGFRLLFGFGSRTASLWLLSGGFVGLVVHDTLYGWAQLSDDYRPGGPITAIAIVTCGVLGCAALHPSMANELEDGSATFVIRPPRIVALSAVALIPLTVLVALTAAEGISKTTRVVTAVSTVAVFVLALARMWGLLGTVRALTERRGHDRLAAMVEHSTDIVALIDTDGAVQYASPGLLSTLGHRPEDWRGRPLVDLVANDDRAAVRSELERVVRLGQGHTVEFEATMVRVDGLRRQAHATIANLVGGDAVDGIVVTLRDITEQRELERQLSHRAFHDQLTGLANRALFLDRMDHALRVHRPNSDPVIVLFVDLDDFKAVNDALGHGVGDMLLRAIADRIRDAVGTGDTPARLGGDEFAVLLEDLGGVERALDIAQDVLESLREPVSVGGYELTVLASIGLAVASEGMSTTSLLRDADIAMYEAKRGGKGQIRIFDPTMRHQATRHLEYRTDLGQALEQNQLRLVYQPIIDLRAGQVVGAEAFVRWRHPVRGEISPQEFLPIAERSGLIVSIGRWIIDEACRVAATWQAAGFRMLSINMSAAQLRDPEFVEHVERSLLKHGLDANRLMLEFKESLLVDDSGLVSSELDRLRALGVRLAIDDFGTGYCSLAHLRRFPVEMVKIDQSFVRELGESPYGGTLAHTILQMTESLGLASLAEGIETEEQLAHLRRLGCQFGQGYLLSSPLESSALSARLGVAAVAPATAGQ